MEYIKRSLKRKLIRMSGFFKAVLILEKTTSEQGCGGIICMCEEVIPIDSNNCFIPCNLI